MSHNISDILLSQLSEFVIDQMGLYFPIERWRDLERGIASAAREFDFKDAESFGQWLLSSPVKKNQIEVLAGHLTVGETYFFREKKSFESLEEHVLPELIRSRRETEQRLRIWSAGCSTGEEAHSIAILLSKMIPDLKDWNITILATDINPRFLWKASEGVYREWSFRNNPPWIQERYFKRTKEGRFEILPYIRNMVTFSYHNLAEDSYPSLLNNTNAMDIIFCRNVLMYFAQDRAKKVIQNLYRSLVDGGWLIVSPSEASHILFSQFVPVNFPEAILYRKDSKKSRMAEDSLQKEITTYKLHDEVKLPLPPVYELVAEPALESVQPQSDKGEVVAESRSAEPQPTLYKEAFALYGQGRYAEAEEKITMLLSQDQDTAKAMILLARVYANQGRLSEALEWCEKAITADRLNPVCYCLLATILQERDQAEEAVASLKRAIYLDPSFVLAHFALANLALRQGKLKESGKHFENVFSLLRAYRQEEILPESEGMTAGRLSEIIASMSKRVRKP